MKFLSIATKHSSVAVLPTILIITALLSIVAIPTIALVGPSKYVGRTRSVLVPQTRAKGCRRAGFGLAAQSDDNDDFPDENNESVLKNLMKDTKDLAVDDWVVAKRDVPSLGIRAGAVYKILSIFLKGTSADATGLGVEVVPLERYGDDNQDQRYTKYLRVYNPRDHEAIASTTEKGVVVTPEEIGLVSVKADWTEALFLAVPGFFWVFVAMAFSNYYTDRYGGNFLDAFFRT